MSTQPTQSAVIANCQQSLSQLAASDQPLVSQVALCQVAEVLHRLATCQADLPLVIWTGGNFCQVTGEVTVCRLPDGTSAVCLTAHPA